MNLVLQPRPIFHIIHSVGFMIFLFLGLHLYQSKSTMVSTFSIADNNSPKPNLDGIAMCGTVEQVEATPISLTKSGLWNQTSIWPNGVLPSENDDVLIPSGTTVTLVGTCRAKSITVNGVLNAVNWQAGGAWIDLRTKYIMVMGGAARLEIGTETNPYISTEGCTITLTGSNKNELIPGTSVNSKGIMIMNNAKLELHGKPVRSWTNLSSNANQGATSIQLTDNSGWKVGDQIVITSSRLNRNEAEERTITSINGNTLTLNSPLAFPHIGVQKTYTRPTDNKSWTVDMRAEVGLLTRNIKIQGDETSESNGFGGHMMIMGEAKAYVENVELYHMGQKATLGRYPFHWHLLEEHGQGQYLKNSSIYKSFNRAITIHGTESVTVENNFCIDHIGHGLFLENGSERFNVIKGNVVGLSRRPVKGEELTPSDNEFNEVQNRTPSNFWITNPNNTFENNVAAGTEGTGFWFAFPQSPMFESASIPRFNGLKPHTQPLGSFNGNKAHSCVSGFDVFDHLTANHSIARNGAWVRTDARLIQNCTWYANDLAIYGGIGGGRTYTQGVNFRNNMFADNRTAVMHANYSKVENSLFVANSGEDVFNGLRQLNRGYDGAWSMINCHMVGWQAENANYVQNTGGAVKHVNYIVEGTTMDHSGPPNMSYPDYSGTPKGEVHANHIHHPRFWSHIMWDKDGSLGGKANTSIVTNHPLCRDGSEVRYENWENLFRTDRRFALLLITYPGENNMTLTRTKSGTPKVGQYYINGFYGGSIQFPLMVNDGFLYTLQFQEVKTTKNFTLRIQDDYVPGDEILMQIKDYGKMGGITVSNATKLSGLNAVRSSNSNAYCIQNGDIYLKAVATNNPDQAFNVSWSTTVQLPLLDTDGDGISDEQESINGTDPIPNDPIPTAQIVNLPTVWEFNQNGNLEGWVTNAGLNAAVSGGSANVNVVGSDPQFVSPSNIGANSSVYKYLRVRVKAPVTGSLQLFWAGGAGGILGTRTQVIPVQASTTFKEYLFDLTAETGWIGLINRLRIDTDFGTTGAIQIDRVSLETENKLDCFGDWEGTAYLDNCNDCVGGNSGKTACPITHWDFNTDNDSEGWSLGSKLTGVVQNGTQQLTVTGSDPNFVSVSGLNVPASSYKYLRFRVKTVSSGSIQLFWSRDDANSFGGGKSTSISISPTNGQFKEYIIDLSAHAEWINIINRLRVDPEVGTGNSIEFDLISITEQDLRDCAGTWEGTASLDNCQICSGGDTGTNPCILTSWQFNTNGDSEGWTTARLNGVVQNGSQQLTVLATDPNFVSLSNLGFAAATHQYARFRVKTASSGQIELFWARNDANFFGGGKSDRINISSTNGEFVEYVMDLSGNTEWKSTISRLRIDPEVGTGNSIEFDLIEFVDEDLRDCKGAWEGTATPDECIITMLSNEVEDKQLFYPNPTSGIVHFSNSLKKNWILQSLDGAVLGSGLTSYVDLSDYPSVIYVFLVEGKAYRVFKH